MTPSVIASHERSKRFHAEIARRASMVPQREARTYFIPNTPFGIKKIQPMLVRTYVRNPEPDWWHCMWFADLIAARDPRAPAPLTIDAIQRFICNSFGLTKVLINSERRTHDIVIPRQIAMYLCKELTTRSLPEIGRRFGGRDHTTVLHAVRKIAARIATDEIFAGKIATLKAEIRS